VKDFSTIIIGHATGQPRICLHYGYARYQRYGLSSVITAGIPAEDRGCFPGFRCGIKPVVRLHVIVQIIPKLMNHDGDYIHPVGENEALTE
jgi:hypothetical protein